MACFLFYRNPGFFGLHRILILSGNMANCETALISLSIIQTAGRFAVSVLKEAAEKSFLLRESGYLPINVLLKKNE